MCCNVPAIKFCCEGATADEEEPEPVVLLVGIVPAVELLFCHVNEMPPPFELLVACTASLIAFIEKSCAENELSPW